MPCEKINRIKTFQGFDPMEIYFSFLGGVIGLRLSKNGFGLSRAFSRGSWWLGVLSDVFVSDFIVGAVGNAVCKMAVEAVS